ncbi:MAG: phosphotransferase enzyme family protein [Fimbriimonadaceae bacterium]
MGVASAKEGYARLSTRRQVALARDAAGRSLAAFAVEPVHLRLLNHGFNTTFRVDCADGSKYAIRVNINSRQTRAKLNAEAAWVEALGSIPGVSVPRLVRTRTDGAYTEVELGEGWPVTSVLFAWVPGRMIGLEAHPDRYFDLGQMAARLHAHAAEWQVPDGAEFFVFRDPLAGAPWRIPEDEVFREIHDRASAALAKLAARPRIPIHYDLHFWNVMLCRGKVTIFDFDDAMLGWPELDASVASFYYRQGPEARLREARFLKGIGLDRYGISDEDFEALVAGRQLLLANEMLAVVTAELVRDAQKWVAVSRRRFEHYLETGTFDRSVATVEE